MTKLTKLRRHMMQTVSEDKKNNIALTLTASAVSLWHACERKKINIPFEDSFPSIIGDWIKEEIPRLAKMEWGEKTETYFRDDLSVFIENNGKTKTFLFKEP